MFKFSFFASLLLLSSSLSAMEAVVDEFAVIGAGLSGLRVAQKMVKSGKHVQVYEARDRVGGRTFTQTINGVSVDLGAELVDQDHHAMWELIKEFGLETKGHNLSHTVMVVDDGEDIDLGALYEIMSSIAKKLGVVAKENKQCCKDEQKIDWNASLFKQLSLTDDERRVLNLIILDQEGVEGDQLPRSYAVGLQKAFESYSQIVLAKQDEEANEELADTPQQFRIVGGTKALVDKIVGDVGKDRIHLSMPLTSLSWDQEEQVFNLRFGDRTATKARKVVMTTPFSVLQRNTVLDDKSLGITPEFRNFIDSMVYGTVSKIVYPTASPVNLCYAIDENDGVCAWAQGENTLSVILGGQKGASVTSESRLGEHLLQRLGNKPKEGVKSVAINWTQDPYSQGSYRTSTTETPFHSLDMESRTVPGLSQFATELYEKGIPVLFGGEHTVWGETGYMNSALRSADAIASVLLKPQKL